MKLDKMQTSTMSNKEITKENYQATAKQFAQNVAGLAPIRSIEKFIKLLPPPKAKIIDLGCGSGRDAKIFTDMGADVLGVDYCSNLIDIAKSHAPLAQFKLIDIETMSFPASFFDGAWSACSDPWNKHDMNLIMKHYADSIEFCSPVVQKVLGDPKGVVYGIDNLRDYFSHQLQKMAKNND